MVKYFKNRYDIKNHFDSTPTLMAVRKHTLPNIIVPIAPYFKNTHLLLDSSSNMQWIDNREFAKENGRG